MRSDLPVQLLWGGRWCLRRVTFRSRARGGSRFEERSCASRNRETRSRARAQRARGGAERPRLPAGRVQRAGCEWALRRTGTATHVAALLLICLVGTEFVYIADYPSAAQGKHFRTVFREMFNVRVIARSAGAAPTASRVSSGSYLRPLGGQFTAGDDRGTRRHGVCSSNAERQRGRATRRPVGLSHERS